LDDFACPEGVTLGADSVRELPDPTSFAESAVSIAVGDLAGSGTPQIYVGTNGTIARLDGEGWTAVTEIWVSRNDGNYPLVAELTGDRIDDLAIGLPNSDDGAGQVVVFPGPVTDPVTWDTPHFELKGSEGSRTGSQHTAADMNGDGQLDLVAKGGICFGPIERDLVIGDEGDVLWSSGEGTSRVGIPGDVDGDGAQDLVFLVGVPWGLGCSSQASELRIFPGPFSAGSLALTEAPIVVPPATDTLSLGGCWIDGTSLRVADIDADGIADIVMAAEDISIPGVFLPEVLVYEGPVAAGAELAARFGAVGWLAAVADLDGDGLADLLQASFDAEWYLGGIEQADAASLLHGPLADLPRFDASSCVYRVDELWSSTALSAAWTGDLDGDGVTDVVVTSGEEAWVLLAGL